MTSDGDIVVAVIQEKSWYRWSDLRGHEDPADVWHILAEALWVE